MIKYSIVMRSVNANLFDINQAKSRIKAAEKAGQTPSSEDVALVATERQNAFAIAQYADVKKDRGLSPVPTLKVKNVFNPSLIPPNYFQHFFCSFVVQSYCVSTKVCLRNP